MSLDDIRARADAASTGPWFAVRYYIGSGQDQGDPDAEIATAGCKLDAEFIANARTDIPKLLAALDAVLSVHAEGTFQRLEPQQECKHCRYAWPCVTVRAITEALR